MDNNKIIESINKTGFPLENEVRNILRKHGWGVINNRYYIDDNSGTEREIDLVAYKVYSDDIEKIAYYTTLIISCKKSDASFWAFLCHNIPEDDPNINRYPFCCITTDRRIQCMCDLKGQDIIDSLKTLKSTKGVFEHDKLVFAFQQINKTHYKAEDDKNIYNSIITLIKAQEAEKRVKESVDTIWGYKLFYNFNLISIFDGDMISINYEDGKDAYIENLNEIKYINRHIINRSDSFHRIHFINKSSFEKILKTDYYNLWKENCKRWPCLISEFYTDIFETPKKVNVLWDEFISNIIPSINISLTNEKYKNAGFDFQEITSVWCSYDKNNKILELHINADSNEALGYLNQATSYGYKRTKKFLKDYYRYDGVFKFEDELPF